MSKYKQYTIDFLPLFKVADELKIKAPVLVAILIKKKVISQEKMVLKKEFGFSNETYRRVNIFLYTDMIEKLRIPKIEFDKNLCIKCFKIQNLSNFYLKGNICKKCRVAQITKKKEKKSKKQKKINPFFLVRNYQK